MVKRIFTITAIALLFTACKKEEKTPDPVPVEDTTDPVITLNGKSEDTVSLKGVYVDPGATATDNIDGDITSKITVSGTITTNRTGGDYLYYNVKDAAGNSAQATRHVIVRNDAYRLEGTYNVISNCGGSFTALSSTAVVQTSNANNNQITISNQQFQSSGVFVSATVSGTSIAMYTQPIASSLGSGTGTISADSKSFTISTSYTPTIQGSAGCMIVYTKQ